MADYLNEIDRRFPVRNSDSEKQQFREYVCDEAHTSGWNTKQETLQKHVNIVIGAPEAAKVIFCAHYDTPRRGLLPNMMLPVNPVLRYLYLAGFILCMLIPALAAGSGVGLLLGKEKMDTALRIIPLVVYAGVYSALFFLLMYGKPNRHNKNDNTSGTAAVLSLMRSLSPRKDIAFILFDNEEKGKLGSAAFGRKYTKVKQNTFVVNMDCVGNGECFLVCESRKMKDHPYEALLRQAFEAGRHPAGIYGPGKASMNSDHRNFDVSVGVCACRKKGNVYYTPRIHTDGDTVADEENIRALCDVMTAFIQKIG